VAHFKETLEQLRATAAQLISKATPLTTHLLRSTAKKTQSNSAIQLSNPGQLFSAQQQPDSIQLQGNLE